MNRGLAGKRNNPHSYSCHCVFSSLSFSVCSLMHARESQWTSCEAKHNWREPQNWDDHFVQYVLSGREDGVSMQRERKRVKSKKEWHGNQLELTRAHWKIQSKKVKRGKGKKERRKGFEI